MIKKSELINTLGVYVRRVLRPDPLRSRFAWYKRERNFINFLNNIKDHSVNTEGSDEILIVIQPWQLTPLPWFLIALAFAFNFHGKKVGIVWDDIGLGMDNAGERMIQRSIMRMLARLPQSIKYFRLSEFILCEKELLSEFQIERLVIKNKTIHFSGEVFPEGSESFENEIKITLRKTPGHIQSLLQKCCPAYIVMGGGGYSSSGLWIELGKMMNIRVATIDSGFSILLVSTDGIAANLDDIPKAFQLLPKEDLWVIDEAKTELKRRMYGKDQFSSQNVTFTGKGQPFGVLLPLNQSYDLAALDRHRVFKNQTEWMLETIEWVLHNSSEKIAVRRHPIERFPQFASNDDYLKCIKDRFGNNERICFIDSKAAINTYDLIEKAKVVVPYVSTVGIEAAALGRTVVTEGDSCYANLGFVWGARNREEYFEYLNRAIKGSLKINEKQKEDAWRCYYLTQCCNWHHTTFTPQPSDFDKWVIENPEELLAKQEVLDILDAIEKNIPLSILAHNNKKKSRTTNI